MAMMGGGLMGYPSGAKSVTLNDKSGVDAFIVYDSDGFPVGKITSNGNIEIKGMLKKTTIN